MCLIAQTRSEQFPNEEHDSEGNFACKARLLTGPEGGLAGIEVEIFNLSVTEVIQLVSPVDCIPIGLVIQDANGSALVAVPVVPLDEQKTPAPVLRMQKTREWTQPPLKKRRYLIPLKRLLTHRDPLEPPRK